MTNTSQLALTPTQPRMQQLHMAQQRHHERSRLGGINSSEFYDLVFLCGPTKEKVYAYQGILATCSTFFEDLFHNKVVTVAQTPSSQAMTPHQGRQTPHQSKHTPHQSKHTPHQSKHTPHHNKHTPRLNKQTPKLTLDKGSQPAATPSHVPQVLGWFRKDTKHSTYQENASSNNHGRYLKVAIADIRACELLRILEFAYTGRVFHERSTGESVVVFGNVEASPLSDSESFSSIFRHAKQYQLFDLEEQLLGILRPADLTPTSAKKASHSPWSVSKKPHQRAEKWESWHYGLFENATQNNITEIQHALYVRTAYCVNMFNARDIQHFAVLSPMSLHSLLNCESIFPKQHREMAKLRVIAQWYSFHFKRLKHKFSTKNVRGLLSRVDLASIPLFLLQNVVASTQVFPPKALLEGVFKNRHISNNGLALGGFFGDIVKVEQMDGQWYLGYATDYIPAKAGANNLISRSFGHNQSVPEQMYVCYDDGFDDGWTERKNWKSVSVKEMHQESSWYQSFVSDIQVARALEASLGLTEDSESYLNIEKCVYLIEKKKAAKPAPQAAPPLRSALKSKPPATHNTPVSKVVSQAIPVAGKADTPMSTVKPRQLASAMRSTNRVHAQPPPSTTNTKNTFSNTFGSLFSHTSTAKKTHQRVVFHDQIKPQKQREPNSSISPLPPPPPPPALSRAMGSEKGTPYYSVAMTPHDHITSQTTRPPPSSLHPIPRSPERTLRRVSWDNLSDKKKRTSPYKLEPFAARSASPMKRARMVSALDDGEGGGHNAVLQSIPRNLQQKFKSSLNFD